MESSISETTADFQEVGAMWMFGVLGSKPWKIGSVLDEYGMEYEKVGLNELTKPGVYIISYWNDSKPFTKGGIHTIAVEYDGKQYTSHNRSGDANANPQTYACAFVCGYYLGER